MRTTDFTQCVRSLYGGADGVWLLLETPQGMIPPPTINVGLSGTDPDPGVVRTLQHLGSALDVFARICADVESMPTVGLRGRNGSIPVQRALGDMLGGISQQSVSRFINGESEPQFSDEQWRMLVRIAFRPEIVVAALHNSAVVLRVGDGTVKS